MIMKTLLLLICISTFHNMFECYINLDSEFDKPLFLTPYIKSGELHNAREAAKVRIFTMKHIESYAGFFTVNSTYNSNLFHWYFVAEENPETAPVILWLNGGPGSSSMLGLFLEHGPFVINGALQLKLRHYHWTKNHHVIYLDNPVGTGYSFTDDEKGYAKNTNDCAVNIFKALKQFFELFPNLKHNDLYLCSESYGGKYIPALAHVIITKGGFPNFKGVSIGNGFTHPIMQVKGIGNYLYEQGFIDDHGLKLYEVNEQDCVTALETQHNVQVCENTIDPFSNQTLFGALCGYIYVYNILHSNPPLNALQNIEEFMTQTWVRNAIHVGNLERYHGNVNVQKHLGNTIYDSEKKHLEELLEQKKYRVLLYSGQLDVIFPYVITVNYLKTLEFQYLAEYLNAARVIWRVGNNVAGFMKTAGPLTEVMVIGAGHMVPMDQPKRGFDLITKFTRNKLLV